MKILTVIAHPNPKSFCHALLQRFTAGLTDAGHTKILKGWFERVFAYGDAYALTPEGWHGSVNGRVPLLHHEKALVISTTLFSEADYEGRLGRTDHQNH